MKNGFKKIISLFIVVASLVSLFSVFVYAEDEEESGGTDIVVLLNRNFDEGWDFTNGLNNDNATSENNVFIDNEKGSDNEYNYFVRFEALEKGASYLSYSGYSLRAGGTVLQASLKADDVPDISGVDGSIAPILVATTTLKEKIKLLGIKDGHLYAYADKSGSNLIDLGPLNNRWLDFAIVFDWDKGNFYYTVYYGENYENSSNVSLTYNNASDLGIQQMQIGIPEAANDDAAAAREGMGFCLDNYRVYNNSKEVVTKEFIDSLGTGVFVDDTLEPTIEILSGSTKSKEQLLEDALCMKLGVDYALFKNVRQPIFTKLIKDDDENVTGELVYGAPEIVDGNVMVPLQLILDYIGFPSYIHKDGMSYDITTGLGKTNLVAGRDSASVNGERVALTVAPGFVSSESDDTKYLVIALDDVEVLFPGWLTIYDDMGLVIIYEDLTPDNSEDNQDIVNRKEDLDLMVSLMKKFIFSTETKDQYGTPLNEKDSYIATGNKVYSDVKANTNNFKHPYIGAKQDDFDKLNKAYTALTGSQNYNAAAKEYLTKLVAKAEEFYKSVAKLSEDGTYIGILENKIPVNVYSDGKNPTDASPDVVADTADGYDPTYGKLPELVEYAEELLNLAFVYQVTRDQKFARLAYDWAVALGNWDHWGPAYMPDCAATTYSYAVAYDWLYNIFKELYGQEGVETIAKAIFENGVHDGYVSSYGRDCEHPRNLGDASKYTTLSTSANAASASGMIVAALSIMEFDSLEDVSGLVDERTYLVGNNIVNLINNGLGVYAPDGSYIESVAHWEMGTNSLFRLVMSLLSAAGTDYGFIDTWGLATTCYYALHIESSDGVTWNYHEYGTDGFTNGPISGVNTEMFNFAASVFNDSTLAYLREIQLNSSTNPKEVTIYDMLFYPFDGAKSEKDLTLDYRMDGLDAFVSRSDWEAGAMYTGIMGGMNNAANSQIDSGNFIYHNKGIVWFMDLGGDNPSVYQYFGSARNHYYRAGVEGQNTVFITSVPDKIMFGQFSGAGGKLTDTFVNEYGSYAKIDNKDVFRNVAITANRGMLVTNNRNTVVIQDEMNLGKNLQSVAWVAHTAHDIEIDETGRIAYLTAKNADGVEYTLRAAIVSPNRKLLFSVMSCDEFLLPGATYGSDMSASYGGADEYSRDDIKRLVIKIDSAPEFNCAVVFEIVSSVGSSDPIGYEWQTMENWLPQESADNSNNGGTQIRTSASKEDLINNANIAKGFYDDGIAFTEKLSEFYDALTNIQFANDYLGSVTDSEATNALRSYREMKKYYNELRDQAEIVIEGAFYFADSLSGVTEFVEEEPEETPEEQPEEGDGEVTE